MKLSRTAWLLAFAAVCLFLLACRNESAPATESAASKAEITPTATPETALSPTPEMVTVAPAEFKKVLTGMLDNNLSLHMELERKGGKLSGSYYYEKAGAVNVPEKPLTLVGKVDKEGKVTLGETAFSAEKGEVKSGEFKGVLDGVLLNGETTIRFLGVWTDGQGKKSLPVSLQELRYDLGGFKFGEKPVQEKNKKARLEISAVVPQLTAGDAAKATAFNKAALAVITKELAQFKKDAAEAVKLNRKSRQKNEKKPEKKNKKPPPPAKPARKPLNPNPPHRLPRNQNLPNCCPSPLTAATRWFSPMPNWSACYSATRLFLAGRIRTTFRWRLTTI